MTKSVDLTQGSIAGHIARLLGPNAIAMIAIMMGGLVDTIFLGRLTHPDISNFGVLALAALGFAYPLTLLGHSASTGLANGTLSAVSRAIGQGDDGRARRHGAAAILMGLCVMGTIVSAMLLAIPFALNLMGAKGLIYTMAKSYLLISLPGLIILSIAVMCVNILRARGEAVLPSSFLIMSALVNLTLDPFLIFGIGPFPRMEVEGAALATVIGHVTAATIGFYVVAFHRKAITFSKMTLGSIKRAWWVIGKVGVPAAGTRIVVPIGATMAVAIIARYLTVEDVAAFTIAGRVEVISIALLFALSGCIGALTGQNGGAGLTDRVRATFKYCYIICCVWGVCIALLFALFATQLAGLFSTNPTVMGKTMAYFYIVPVTIFASGFVFVSSAGLNALGRPIYGLLYTILQSVLLYVGLIYLGVMIDGLRGAFFGMAVANLLAGFIAIGWTLSRVPLTAKKS